VAVVTNPTVATPTASDLALVGQFAIVAASCSYAIGAVYARRFMATMRPMSIAMGQVLVGLVVSASLAAAIERPMVNGLRPEAILSVVWLGVLGSGVALLIFYRLLANWGATRTHSVTYLLPPVGVILGIVLGTALIIAGVALVNARQGVRRLLGRTDPPPPEPADP